MELLIINGHDYSPYIRSKGYGWSREDLDTDQTVRTKDGRIRRDKIGTKRKLSYTLCHMGREELARLDEDLSQTSFQARYLDLHGAQTRLFYCSSFSATLETLWDGGESWSGAAFHLIEV